MATIIDIFYGETIKNNIAVKLTNRLAREIGLPAGRDAAADFSANNYTLKMGSR